MKGYLPFTHLTQLQQIMNHTIFFHRSVAAGLAALILLFQPLSAQAVTNDGVRQYIQEAVQSLPTTQMGFCRSERLCDSSAITRFYEQRAFEPAWQIRGFPRQQAYDLIDILKQADTEGLYPSDYHTETLQQLLPETEKKASGPAFLTPELRGNIDLLLTDAFFLYAAHLLSGRVDPETIYPEWDAFNPQTDLAKILGTTIRQDNIASTLKQLTPPHRAYQNLKAALKTYRQIVEKGGWPTLTISATLRRGDRTPEVAQLRRRLMSNDSPQPLSPAPEDAVFDEVLVQCVKYFQATHGLTVDGIVGPETLKALNIPADKRVRQIELNLERWRWLPHDLGRRHIRVNIADYSLTAVENSETVLHMRIVAGKPYWQTPVFSRKMQYMVINPFWNIPHKIAVSDILTKVQEDNTYLDQQNITIFANWENNAREIDPSEIDWSQINAVNFDYKLRQAPGPLNPLGRLKFIFPNKYAVYLHDTPTRHLFKKNSRSFSHGCIRLEKPIELAQWILEEDSQWTNQTILNAVKKGDRSIISIRTPLDVHLLYWTAWADEQGQVHFRNDIYKRDRPLDRALRLKRAEHNGQNALYFTNIEPVPYRHE